MTVPAPITLDPDLHWLIVNKELALRTGLREDKIRERICSASRRPNSQRPAPDFRHHADACPQPAVVVCDGQRDWTITFTLKLCNRGNKKACFVVDVKPSFSRVSAQFR